MKLKSTLLITCLILPLLGNATSWLWGTTPQNHIGVGAFAWHVQDTFGAAEHDPHYLVYPYVGVTYDSANIMYFKNTYRRSTMGLTIERDVVNKALSKNFSWNVNYQVGTLFFGYCIKSLSCEPPSARIIPIAILSSRIEYKKRYGFSVSVMGPVVIGTFQYLF